MANLDVVRTCGGEATSDESRVVTVLFECRDHYRARDRLDAIQEVIDAVSRSSRGATLLLFPAGWIKAPVGTSTARALDQIVRFTQGALRPARANVTVCVGVNGRRIRGNAYDQLAVVVGATGVQAIARKFYAAPGEKIDAPGRWSEGESGFSRTVQFGGKRLFVAVCYDVFAIRQLLLPRPRGVDGVLNLVHGFGRAGTAGSGDVLFARHGLAAASCAWRRSPVFASASFFDRPIAPRWPSGVRWRGAATSTMTWTYGDNSLHPKRTWRVHTSAGAAEVREFPFG